MIRGQTSCDKYGYGVYSGKSSGSGCGWDTSKVECCKPVKDSGMLYYLAIVLEIAEIF